MFWRVVTFANRNAGWRRRISVESAFRRIRVGVGFFVEVDLRWSLSDDIKMSQIYLNSLRYRPNISDDARTLPKIFKNIRVALKITYDERTFSKMYINRSFGEI